MLYKIKTKAEIPSLPHSLPKEVISEAERVAEILDDWTGKKTGKDKQSTKRKDSK